MKQTGRLKILVVDDEEIVRLTLSAMIDVMGHTAECVNDGLSGKAALESSQYDAAFVDIRMPGSTGLDLHRELHEKIPLLADRIVFITGDFVNDELLCQALETGRLLLEKPFTMRELATALGKTVTAPLLDGGQRLSA